MNENTQKPHTSSLGDDILRKIEEEKIEPRARGVFLFQNMLFWVLWGVTILAGALAVATLIFTELNVGWEFYTVTHDNALTFFVETVPYVWVVLLALLVLLGVFNYRHTKKGYRRSLLFIMLLGVGASMIGGAFIHNHGMSGRIEAGLGKYIPFHTSPEVMKERFWDKPERGLYSGVVTAVDESEEVLILEKRNGEEVSLSLEHMLPLRAMTIREGDHIRVVATTSGKDKTTYSCHTLNAERTMARSVADRGVQKEALMESQEMVMDHLERYQENPCRGSIMKLFKEGERVER